MPSDLKPKIYPDFTGKEEHQSYKSKKTLGRLYRQIKDAYDDDDVAASSKLNFVRGDIPYDLDLEVLGATDFISDAWDRKCSYDWQRVRCMCLHCRHKVKREEEVVTGHVWSMPKGSSRKQGDLKQSLKHSYNCCFLNLLIIS
ncbi:hypothetical protein Peur_014073 [Populus x canadensis]